MSIEILQPRHRDEAVDLWAYCFGDSPEFIRWYLEKRCAPGRSIGWFEDGKLLSAVHLVPRRISVRGCWMDASLVVGVATWPHARGRGIVTRLLACALEDAAKHGEDWLPLYPFSHGFYERLGWATAYERLQAEGALADLPAAVKSGVLLAPEDPAESVAFAQVYAAAMGGRSGFLERNRDEWRLRAEEMAMDGARGIIARDAEGNPVGALIYALDGSAVRVQEWMASTHAAEQAMLGFLAAHRSSHETFSLWLPPDSPSRHGLPGGARGHRLLPDVMVRLADAARTVSALGLSGPKLAVRVVDRVIEQNDGVFLLQDGRMTPAELPSEATLTINALAALAMGSADIEALLWRGTLTGSADAIEKLRTWFFPAPTCIFEHW